MRIVNAKNRNIYIIIHSIITYGRSGYEDNKRA